MMQETTIENELQELTRLAAKVEQKATGQERGFVASPEDCNRLYMIGEHLQSLAQHIERGIVALAAQNY